MYADASAKLFNHQGFGHPYTELASTINLPHYAHYTSPLLTKMHFHWNTTSPEGCNMVGQTREINHQDYSPI